jgi:acyl carrier protein
MTRDDLLPELLKIARDVIGDDDLVFAAETPFERIEEWDSMNHVHIIVGMEDAFGIRFDDAVQLQGVVKVQDLLDIIAGLKGL